MPSSSDIPDLISYETVEMRGNLAVITFSIPYDLLKSFKTLLNNFLLLTSYVTIKARHCKAKSFPSQPAIDFNSEYIKKRDKRIVTLFDSFLSAGATPRAACRSVRDEMNRNGNQIDCYMVELIIRASGRFSKRKARVIND